jgi:hypothetical protein
VACLHPERPDTRIIGETRSSLGEGGGVRASVWLTGLVLLVGGYAVLLLLAQSTVSGLEPSVGTPPERHFVPSWDDPLLGERATVEAAPPATNEGIRFNQHSAGRRVGIGLGPTDLDAPLALTALAGLPSEMLARSGNHVGLAAGLTGLIGLSAAAALLRRA